MAGGGTGIRKYVGALKDTTTVSIAKVNSNYKELDIALVKATNHVERPAKEKYIRDLFYHLSPGRPRADVAYCIRALGRRLSKTRNWAVALKTLVVVHRALREVDPTFRDEFISYGRTSSHMLHLSYFKDDSSAEAWDYSAWVRNYALYLEERIESFRVLNYDVEKDPLRTRDLDTIGLLEQLPALQQLLFRLLDCQPQGSSSYNTIIQHALSMVALESVRIQTAINDAILNLVDKFFEMQRDDAIRALDMYKRAISQAEQLSEFYEVCKSIHIGRGERFLKIEKPPASFLATMEEYVSNAPLASMVQRNQAVLAIEYNRKLEAEEPSMPPPPAPASEPVPEPVKEVPPAAEPTDLLAGGLDLLTLDSLYNEAHRQAQQAQQNASQNPWETVPASGPMMQQPMYDPFYASNSIAAARNVQMVAMAQQQHAFMLQQEQQRQMMMVMAQQQQASSNPFADPYMHPGAGMQLHARNAYTGTGMM